ncbi:MAG: DUF429 domain-containing protein [Chloroflexota bacterium]
MRWGIDGCSGGWIALALNDDGTHTARLYADIRAFWKAQRGTVTRALIDIPIGLPEDDTRPVDALARKRLRSRRSSVFAVPVRAAFDADDYAAACDINQQYTGRRFSKQTWNIMPRIREVDALLRQTKAARPVLLESHPEVVFAALSGGRPMGYSKRHALGFLTRLEVLEGYIPAARSIIRRVYAEHAKALNVDDVVDALALATAARFDRLASVPEDPDTDAHGLPMQIVYPVF